MADKKQEIHETVSVDIDSQTHIGALIIEGTRKLRFRVEYKGLSKTDSRSWGTSSEEQRGIRIMAKVHLLSLVREVKDSHK